MEDAMLSILSYLAIGSVLFSAQNEREALDQAPSFAGIIPKAVLSVFPAV